MFLACLLRNRVCTPLDSRLLTDWLKKLVSHNSLLLCCIAQRAEVILLARLRHDHVVALIAAVPESLTGEPRWLITELATADLTRYLNVWDISSSVCALQTVQ